MIFVITPIAECIDVQSDGTIVAKFGYQSNAQGDVEIPVGPNNQFLPSPADRGQPVTFTPGRVVNSFSALFPASETLEWILGGASVTVDLSVARCGGSQIECVETDNTKTLGGLDTNALRQRANVRALVRRALAVGVSPSTARQLAELRKSADELYLTQWTGIWGSFAKITNTCTGCLDIQKQPDIDAIITRSRQFRRLSRRVFDILSSASGGRVSAADMELYRKAQALHDTSAALAAKLPTIVSQCS